MPDEIKVIKPVAFVILKSSQQASEDLLKPCAHEHALVYMHPQRVWIVDAFPLAGTNLIHRRVVTTQAMERLAA